MSKYDRFTPPEAERKIITLDNLIDPTRQIPKEYQPLIHKQEQIDRSIATEYSIRWSLFLDQIGTIPNQENDFGRLDALFKTRLSDSALVDLGGGRGYYMKKLAQRYGMTYINVDRFQFMMFRPPDPFVPVFDRTTEGLHEICVKSDLLDFVSRMKDDAANFVLNGINESLINNPNYHKALAEELIRASRPGGLIFGVNATALDLLVRNPKRTTSQLIEHSFDVFEFTSGKEHIFEVVK